MNNDNRYQVTASLFMLREIKRRQEQVNKGYQLLKRKTEALRFKGRQVASELCVTQAMLGHTLKEAYISLAAIKFTNGETNALILENLGQAQIRVQRIPENTSGVATISFHPVEDSGAGDALRYAGLGAGGHRTMEAKKAFREAVRNLIKFASLRNTCILLDKSIRSTLRKVNGIEKVIIPKLRNTEVYILTEMDEIEREEFHRLKLIKAKKVRAQALASFRVTTNNKNGKEVNDSLPLAARRFVCVERLASLFPARDALSSGSDCGDSAPPCYPHHWDDIDLLF